MKNIEMNVENDILIVKIDLTKEFGESNSGKTIIIASSEGNQNVTDNKGIKIGINCYRKK